MLSCALSYAQAGKVCARLVDASTGDALGFATVSLTRKNADEVYKYVLSNDKGEVLFEDVRNGSYSFRAELMGYKDLTLEIAVKGTLDLGDLKLTEDKEVLEAASVSAVGNPVVVKKDTVEYNAGSFKTTEDDALVDLLKKLPGVEVGADGAVTVNGEAVKKITIGGKTFFLDDPSIASANLPARLIEKVKVVRKKSEQAEFTGFDDGERETVIDLSIKRDAFKGTFGKASAGVGKDIPSEGGLGDTRFQSAAFAGRFTDKTQISLIYNGNNTNNRGFSDVSGTAVAGPLKNSVRNTGSGITTSYTGGANAVTEFFDGAMLLGGNYIYNNSANDVLNSSYKETYLKDAAGNDYNRMTYKSSDDHEAVSTHRFGVRMEYKTKNTWIVFQPQFNIKDESFVEKRTESVTEDRFHPGGGNGISDSKSDGTGRSRTLNASGMMFLSSKLGLPGRTLTVVGRYKFDKYDLSGINLSNTRYFESSRDSVVNQRYNLLTNSGNFSVKASYTEPLGNNFYASGVYSYEWKRTVSDKDFYNFDYERGLYSDIIDPEYSLHGNSLSQIHNIGANLLYQSTSAHLQAGFFAVPSKIVNKTDKYDYDSGLIWNFSPQISAILSLERTELRLSYVGTSSHPDVDQLHTVADNTDPLDIRFGNPFLEPYFSHNLSGEFSYRESRKFFTLRGNFNAGMVKNPIVNSIWYGKNGIQYSMPFNGPNSANAGFNAFANAVIRQSGLSVTGNAGLRWNKSGYFVGNGVDMTTYETKGFYAFMDEFHGKSGMDIANDDRFVTNSTNTISPSGSLGMKYSLKTAEFRLNGGTSICKSWYKLGEDVNDNTTTFNNFVNLAVVWTIDPAGLTLKADCRHNWYDGYSGLVYEPETILDAEIQKLLFKKKCTLALRGYDLLCQAKTLSVSDASNYHMETYSNTLGRYVILAFTYRFGDAQQKMKKH